MEKTQDTLTPFLNGMRDDHHHGGIEQSVEIGELMKALSEAQSKITGAEKNATNPYFKSNYADLHTVIESCRPHLTKVGIAFIQFNDYDPVTDSFYVGTQLGHKSGQWIRTRVFIPLTKVDPQGVGGACTYGRRYGLSGMVGIGQFDDDGNALMIYEKTQGEIARFAELLTSNFFDGKRNDVKTWWTNLNTHEQVNTGLNHMENQVDKFHEKKTESDAKKEEKKRLKVEKENVDNHNPEEELAHV